MARLLLKFTHNSQVIHIIIIVILHCVIGVNFD